jgi:hypothetical protein
MTTREFVHRAEVVGVTLNGNADFWSAHHAADLIGGKVSDLANGLAIEEGRVYNFENLSLDDVNVFIERVEEGSDSYFTVTVRDAETSQELLFDETADTLSDAFEVLASWAPAPLPQSIWDASELAPLGDPSEIFYNCMVITNFKWVDDDRGISSVGQLAIYAHRVPVEDLVRGASDHFFSIYHTFNGGANVIDLQFTSFTELLSTVEKHSELQEIRSHRD